MKTELTGQKLADYQAAVLRSVAACVCGVVKHVIEDTPTLKTKACQTALQQLKGIHSVAIQIIDDLHPLQQKPLSKVRKKR